MEFSNIVQVGAHMVEAMWLAENTAGTSPKEIPSVLYLESII